MVEYTYDAWGNCKIDESTTDVELANLNPFRYRSYYYDTETCFYFLKTRYYDPEIGRFTTIDDISYLDPESINGLNLYAYCLDNPVKYYDPTGESLLAIGLILLATTIAGGVVGGVVSYDQGNRGWNLVKDVIFGAGVGLAIGGAFVATSAVCAGAIAAMSYATTATVFGGVAISQAFAIGALAFNAFAYVIAPLYGILDVQGIEYEPIAPYTSPSNKSNYVHPGMN